MRDLARLILIWFLLSLALMFLAFDDAEDFEETLTDGGLP